MRMRKDILVNGENYHIFTKTIAEFKVFHNDLDYSRIMEVMRYYQREKTEVKFSRFIRNPQAEKLSDKLSQHDKLVEVIAYCVMPTHIHLILRQLKNKGISVFMNNVLNSYTRYFNIKHDRKGPLWEGRFKNIRIRTDEQLFHLTRYIHLNPVTVYLVDEPEDWDYSSYREYVFKTEDPICKFSGILDIDSGNYKNFVSDRISYQRGLAKIKGLIRE